MKSSIIKQNMRNLTHIKSVFWITVISVALSLMLYFAVAILLDAEINRKSIFMTIIIPALVASFVSNMFIKNAKKIESLKSDLYRMATIDSLTGLATRPVFMSEAEELHRRALDNRVQMTVVYMDLDNFKDINDMFGHAAGDAALVYAGEAIRETFGIDVLKGRIGGDEISIVLYDTQRGDMIDMLQKFRAKLSGYRSTFHGSNINILTVSIGISESIPYRTGLSFDAMLAQADKALYYAKHHGKNCAVSYGKHGKPELLIS